MQEKLSDTLISISNTLMLAQDRTDAVRLAGGLNDAILRAIEMENASKSNAPSQKTKTLSTSIKFTMKEIEKMSKTFKREFIANGLAARVIKRPSGKRGFYYEIRYRRNGYNLRAANKDLAVAKALFVELTKNLKSPAEHADKNLEFGFIANEWLKYKNGKIDQHTWNGYARKIELYFSSSNWNTIPISKIRTSDIDDFMRQFKDDPRGYEDTRTVFNQIFKYAIASGVIMHNPVTLVPFKRAERKNRNALSREKIISFLTCLKSPKFDKIRKCAYILYFFGLRPCEIDKSAHFENGFLVCRNRKRQGGKIEYKKIPIHIQAHGLIDFDAPIKYECSYSCFARHMGKALGKGNSPYNLRHTFASLCSENVKGEVVDVWMGDSPERLVGKVYVHFSDKFMQEQMEKVNFPAI